jgi:hypothetical protein
MGRSLMELCTTTSLQTYRQLPEILKNSSRVIIREAVICDAARDDINWLSRQPLERILWFDEYLPKNEILPVAAEFKSKKIMCPATTIDNVDAIENAFADSDISVIVIPNAQTSKVYLAIVCKCLISKVIAGIGFDYHAMRQPFSAYAVPEFLMRPRVLEYMNDLYGFSLYNKELHCLKMSGALTEIFRLYNLGYVDTLISDIALSCARSCIRLDESSILPTEFDSEFVKRYHIDDPNIDCTLTEQMRNILFRNIDVMRQHGS